MVCDDPLGTVDAEDPSQIMSDNVWCLVVEHGNGDEHDGEPTPVIMAGCDANDHDCECGNANNAS